MNDRSRMSFTDVQILTLVLAHPGLNLYQLRQVAEKDMGQWHWTVGKVHKAVARLEKAGKVETNSEVIGGRACVQVRATV